LAIAAAYRIQAEPAFPADAGPSDPDPIELRRCAGGRCNGDKTMAKTCNVTFAGLIGGMLTLASFGALAGECPADQKGVDVTKAGATMPEGVTDNVLAAIDLSKEMIATPDRMLRLRRLEIQPGGVVPWHSHDDRPAIIYVVSGEIYEHASTCAVPILHKAGEVAPEMRGTAHWWKNEGKTPVVLLSSDILHSAKDDHMM
jgi:quercetin dioxygenase-like cupin family protein